MKRSQANAVWLHVSAFISLVCWVLVIIGTSEYVGRYQINLGPPSERDIWEGGDVVQAIKQRAQTAALYLTGFAFSLAIMIMGATAQSLLTFRQTKDVPTAVRSFFQMELVYQAIKSHQTGSKVSAKEKESRNLAAHVSRMSNCCIFFLLGLLGFMVSFIGVLQRPLRATVNGNDLNSIWAFSSLVLGVYIGITVAQHLSNAEWSFWHAKPTQQLVPQTQQSSQQDTSSADQPPLVDRSDQHGSAHNSTITTVMEEPNIGPRQVLRGVLRVIACTVSVIGHLYVYLLLSVSIRGLVLAVVVGHWIVSSLLYYAVSRKIADSLYWGFLSFMMHMAFNRMTHRKAWWVAVVTAILFSGTGVACGLLQLRMYLFTYQYTTAEYTGGTNNLDHVSLETDVGLSALAAAAIDLLVHTITVLIFLRKGGADKFEAEVQMPTISTA